MREISSFSRTTLRSAMILFLVGSLAVSEVAAARQRTHYGLTISGTPASGVLAGQTYTFTPTAYDSRTRTLVFAIANQPSWATFSSSNGQLSGTPTAANVGTYSSIVIAVSDGYRTATLPAFSVSVSAAAAPVPAPTPPPVISGTPPTSVQAGSSYTFQPTASDPGGLTLAFSVQNKPAWATFSIVNGLLSGTPGSSQAGTYANVVISASDGQHSSALPAFSINVTSAPAVTGTALLDLTVPTQNTDGSALTDLAGVRIYYGTSPANLAQVVQLAGATVSSYTVSNLTSGTWYFGATAYTSSGTESALSPIVSKSIP
jgi:hypothetical protein